MEIELKEQLDQIPSVDANKNNYSYSAPNQTTMKVVTEKVNASRFSLKSFGKPVKTTGCLIITGLIILFIAWTMGIIPKIPYMGKPKTQEQVLSDLKSITPEIEKIDDFTIKPYMSNCGEAYFPCTPKQIGYIYTGYYYLKGLDAKIYFQGAKTDNFDEGYELSNWTNDYSFYKKDFHGSIKFNNIFTETSWASFKKFYNSLKGEDYKVLGRIARFGLESNYGLNETQLSKLVITGHNYNDILVVYAKSNPDCGQSMCTASVVAYDKTTDSWSLITTNYKKYLDYFDSQISVGKEIGSINWDVNTINQMSFSDISARSVKNSFKGNSLTMQFSNPKEKTKFVNPLVITGSVESKTGVKRIVIWDISGKTYEVNDITQINGDKQVNFSISLTLLQSGSYGFKVKALDVNNTEIPFSSDGSYPEINDYFYLG